MSAGLYRKKAVIMDRENPGRAPTINPTHKGRKEKGYLLEGERREKKKQQMRKRPSQTAPESNCNSSGTLN